MAEIMLKNVPCLFYPGKVCTGDCGNYPEVVKDIKEIAGEYQKAPQTVVDLLRTDPRVGVMSGTLHSIGDPRINSCVHKVVQ